MSNGNEAQNKNNITVHSRIPPIAVGGRLGKAESGKPGLAYGGNNNITLVSYLC